VAELRIAREGGVARLTLDRSPLNVLTTALIDALGVAFRDTLDIFQDPSFQTNEFYDTDGRPAAAPTFLQFPADPLLHGRRVLIVDEVWDTGTTIAAVIDRVRQAGGLPTTAVLHYKPSHSLVDAVPDHHVVTTDRWVVYPFKAGA